MGEIISGERRIDSAALAERSARAAGVEAHVLTVEYRTDLVEARHRLIGEEVHPAGVAPIEHHKAVRVQATLTAVQPPGRFGALEMKGERVHAFQEKPTGDGGWINGGFFVLEPSVLNLVADDATKWERYPLEQLASTGQLSAYRHLGFWQPMDTLRDKIQLEALWASGNAPWKKW